MGWDGLMFASHIDVILVSQPDLFVYRDMFTQ